MEELSKAAAYLLAPAGWHFQFTPDPERIAAFKKARQAAAEAKTDKNRGAVKKARARSARFPSLYSRCVTFLVRPLRSRFVDKGGDKKHREMPSCGSRFGEAGNDEPSELYAKPADPARPVVCFDESPTQMIGESRTPIPVKPGTRAKIDYEYRRNGAANLFVFLDAHRPWRHVKVTDRRTAIDYAHCMRDLDDVHYPHAEKIRVVQDNLSTHRPGALYQAYPPEEARRILRRLEFHYVPKHASWLNMVEIEIGVLYANTTTVAYLTGPRWNARLLLGRSLAMPPEPGCSGSLT